MTVFSRFHSGTFKSLAFFSLLSIFLVSQPAHAQTPACAVAGDAGNSYETCTSGVCEDFICNGSAYVTLNSRAFAGWESIKFGNSTQTCNSARSGRLRYAGGSTWEYCNGTAWTAFGGGGGSVTWPQSVTSATGGDIFQITGSSHNFLGFSTDASNTSVLLGREAGNAATAVSYNTFIGYQAGTAQSSGGGNTFIGSNSGSFATSALYNAFVGYGSGWRNTTGQNSVVIGALAAAGPAGVGYVLGQNSVVIGYQAATSSSSGMTGTYNVVIGGNSGGSLTTGYANSFLGQGTGGSTTTGNQNVFIGMESGYSNSTASLNTFAGYYSGRGNTTGTRNTYLGSESGQSNSTSNDNTAIGYRAGYTAIGGTNTFIGAYAGNTTLTGATNIMIGYNITATSNSTSEELNIGNAIYGTLNDADGTVAKGDNDSELVIDGIVKIGERNPTCNATYEGYMRYNNTTKKMQYCNATAWTDM